MTRKQARDLIRRINRNRWEDDKKATMYEDYSGRAMFGTKTTGVVCGPRDWHFDSKKNRAGYRWDNMGLDMIIY